MSVHPITRPAASSHNDLEDIANAMARSRRRPMNNEDWPKFLGWMLGINALLVTEAICGGINFAINLTGRMSTVEAKIDLIVQGHLK
jgi:hypothetical protein